MPSWNITVKLKDVWRNDGLSFEKRVEAIVERIKASGWRDLTPYPDLFDDLVHNLGEASDPGEFDYWFAEFYDLADSDRVWIETF